MLELSRKSPIQLSDLPFPQDNQFLGIQECFFLLMGWKQEASRKILEVTPQWGKFQSLLMTLIVSIFLQNKNWISKRAQKQRNCGAMCTWWEMEGDSRGFQYKVDACGLPLPSFLPFLIKSRVTLPRSCNPRSFYFFKF